MVARFSRLLLLALVVVAVSSPAPSQTKARRPLTHNDYATWKSIQSPVLSPDGTYLAYAVTPQEGDGDFIVCHLTTGKEQRHPRGSGLASVTPTRRGGRSSTSPGPSSVVFSPDGKFVLFPIYPTFAQRQKAKGKGATVALDTALGVMELPGGKVTRIDRMRSYQVPEENVSVVAYLRGKADPVPDPTKGKSKSLVRPGKNDSKQQRRPAGELVLRDLANGKERTFADVTEFSLARDGKVLVYAVAGSKEKPGGVYAITPGQESAPVVLRSGPGRYSRLTWDEKQTQLVFFHTQEPTRPATGTRPQVRICHWKRPTSLSVSRLMLPSPAIGLAGLSLTVVQAPLPGAVDLTPAGKPAVQPGYEIGEQGGLSFSPDGSRIYFGLLPPVPPKPPAVPGQERANVELWHYNDDLIQPIQKVNGERLRQRSYQAVFHLADRTCRQLADESLANVQFASAGDWALGLDDRAYRRLVGIEQASAPADAYLLNIRTGERKLLIKKQSSSLAMSPEGKFILSFDGKDWYSTSVPSGKRVNLTGKLDLSFASETHDTPSTPPPYGIAGWTKDDREVLLYDRYDIWQIALDGSSARNLTNWLGRKLAMQLRVVRLDFRERAFDPAKPLLVRAENERTRDTGFYRVPFTGSPKLLIMGARNYSTPVKARKADRLLLTVSTFYTPTDLYVADPDFRELRKVSDANPQKANFIWGKAELIKYKNADGVPLQGVLIKPENFDSRKKYPMIVYIYERLSQNLHRFVAPQPGTSINPSYYASNGYLVLMPDIVYTEGYPGQSAVKCVLPAIQAVVDQGCVNEKAIGIQGHSWGGYQTAYLVTQTTRFKAAAAGAPVCNMTSAYGGIRWGSGLPRQFQYEKTQSRIGGTLWQYPTRFLENSPLFHADRIKTPLLMLHNDRDEAVPWQQGIEFYLALRRLGKEAYLFNYPGEFHGLRQRVNQKDYTVRMQQFFDHHLKGAAKPAWMAKGIPYTPPASPVSQGRAVGSEE